MLAAPSEFAKDAIERILRLPISGPRPDLGVAVTLAVVVDASAVPGGSDVPDPVRTGRTNGMAGNGVWASQAADHGAGLNGTESNGGEPGPPPDVSDALGSDGHPSPAWSPVVARDDLRRPGTGPLEFVGSDGAAGHTALDGWDPAVRPSYAAPRPAAVAGPGSTKSTPSTRS